MIAVIFELQPAKDAQYFTLAAALKSRLEEIPGFISVERFESLSLPGRYLSLSFWENEDAVREWRNHSAHRDAQAEGRGGVLADYRLRVAHVMRDYGMNARDAAPADSRAAHEGRPQCRS